MISFDRWLFDEYKIGNKSTCVFRIIYSVYIVLFIDLSQFRELANVPNAFFHPPYGPMLVFDGFPGDFFFYSLEGVAAFSIIALLFGYYIRLASLLTGISLLVGYGFLYSLGKVNHNILVLIIPLFMAGSNWGSRLSLDALHGRVPDRKSTGWPIALIAASLAVAMFIAGAGKVIGGWFDPSLQATQSHLVHQFFANERQDLLAPHLLSISNANQGLKNHVAAGGLKKDASNI